MKPRIRIAVAAILAFGCSVFAAQPVLVQAAESNAFAMLAQLDGDHVLVTPGKSSATKASLTPYAEFVARHGGGDSRELVTAGESSEGKVPTPDPPSSGIGYEPGDSLGYLRRHEDADFTYRRETTLVYDGRNNWIRTRNDFFRIKIPKQPGMMAQ